MSLSTPPAHRISESGTLFWSPADRLAKIAPGAGDSRFTIWFMEHGHHRGFVEVDDLTQARAVACHFVLGQDSVKTRVHRLPSANESRLAAQTTAVRPETALPNQEFRLLAA